MDAYDVIIVGTGRGRRHARPPPRAVGQEDPAARARRLAAARAGELGRAGRLRRQPLRLAGHLVRRATASRSSRRSTTSSAARPSSTAPRSTGCGRRTSASSATTTASRPPGRSPTTSSSRTTRRPSSCYEVHGARGEDPTEGPASAPYPFPAVSHEPRIQQLADDLEAAGYHPFHAPCGIRLDEANLPYSTLHPLRRPATASRASSTRSPTPRCSACGPALEHANVTLLTNAQAVKLETNADGHGRHRGRRRARRRDRALSPPTSSSSRAARPTRRSCCSTRRTTSTRTASPTAPTRSAATTCSTTSVAVLALSREENPTVFQKTLGLNDFYFGSDELRVPARQHPDGRQVAGADVPRRAARRDEARAAMDARADRAPRDRLLALDRGPAAARATASPSTATASSRSRTRRRTRWRRSGCTRSSSRCSASST